MYKKFEQYPSKRRLVQLLDVSVYVVGILGPILTVPQVIEIFTLRDATGVSAVTWFAYTVITIPWIAYGFVHKENVLIINNILWFIFSLLVFIGALIY